jgi:hypothetical protein
MYLGFRGFHSTGEYFPNLEPHFCRSICAHRLQPVRAAHKFRLLLALPDGWLLHQALFKKHFERSLAVERLERFEPASVFFGSPHRSH